MGGLDAMGLLGLATDVGHRRSLRYGLLTGVFMALQLMSSIYYGLFLAVILAAVGAIQMIAMGRRAVRAIVVLAAGAAILAITAWVYSRPYRQASARVGVRTTEEMRRYSAVPSSYFRVPEANRVLGRWRAGSTELSLYPGIVPVALGLIALVAMRPTRITLAYARAWRWRPTSRSASTASSIRISRTMSRSSRAFVPRRARRFCSCCAWPSSRPAPRRHPRAIPGESKPSAHGDRGADPVEYWSAPMRLVSYPRSALLYELLAQLPDGNVLELPVPQPDGLPFHDASYLYTSTFHWKTLVNGYSGYYPPSYIRRLRRLATLPSPAALDQIRADNVRWVVVHEQRYRDPAEAGARDRRTHPARCPAARPDA